MPPMTLPAEKRRYSIEEYLRMERDSSQKHEFHFGEILAMSGGSPNHSLIAANILRELGNRLKGKSCRVYDSNLRVCVSTTGQYVYPDGTVVCGPLQFDANDLRQETVTNPRLIVEVLSQSTESYDRKGKFDAYRKVDSLEEYVLASQDTLRIEVLLRQADGSWAITVFTGWIRARSCVRFKSICRWPKRLPKWRFRRNLRSRKHRRQSRNRCHLERGRAFAHLSGKFNRRC